MAAQVGAASPTLPPAGWTLRTRPPRLTLTEVRHPAGRGASGRLGKAAYRVAQEHEIRRRELRGGGGRKRIGANSRFRESGWRSAQPPARGVVCPPAPCTQDRFRSPSSLAGLFWPKGLQPGSGTAWRSPRRAARRTRWDDRAGRDIGLVVASDRAVSVRQRRHAAPAAALHPTAAPRLAAAAAGRWAPHEDPGSGRPPPGPGRGGDPGQRPHLRYRTARPRRNRPAGPAGPAAPGRPGRAPGV